MKIMRLKNLRVYKTNEVVTHYSGELVDAEDNFYVEFPANTGTRCITAYNPERDESYPIDSVNGNGEYNISDWQDGDLIEISEAINDLGVRLL